MKVLVTGATGFLGKRLALKLRREGYTVIGLGRNKEIGRELEENDIHFVPCDIRDEPKVVSLCKEMDYVFHCAALSTPWGKYKDFYEINVRGTKNIIKGCQLGKVKRLIYVSTSSIYFDRRDRNNILESDPLPKVPINDYTKTKMMAENEIDLAFGKGLPVITLRPRALFGPGDMTLMPWLMRANQQWGVPFVNGGKVLTDLTYIDNAVDALLLCMRSKEESLGKKYNISNGEPLIFEEVIKYTFGALGVSFRSRNMPYEKAHRTAAFMEWSSKTFLWGKEPPWTKYTVEVLSKSLTLDIQAAKTELGYCPKVSVKEGIVLFSEWWKKIHESGFNK